jgi:hypothetical protein
MPLHSDEIYKLLENPSSEGSFLNTDQRLQLSIAISLKRIADILNGSCKEYTPLDKIAAAALIYKDKHEFD